MYKYLTLRAETRSIARNAPAPRGFPATSRRTGWRGSLVLTALVFCAIIGALWTYHDLRHPQDSLSAATPLLGIALLLLATRMRKRSR